MTSHGALDGASSLVSLRPISSLGTSQAPSGPARILKLPSRGSLHPRPHISLSTAWAPKPACPGQGTRSQLCTTECGRSCGTCSSSRTPHSDVELADMMDPKFEEELIQVASPFPTLSDKARDFFSTRRTPPRFSAACPAARPLPGTSRSQTYRLARSGSSTCCRNRSPAAQQERSA